MKISKHRLFSLMALGLFAGTVAIGNLPGPAMAQSPEAIRSYNQGIEAYTQGRPNDALKKFQRATQLDPAYGDAYYNMGSIYYQMKQYDTARDMFQKSVNLNPGDSQAKYNLALALEKLARYEEAVNILSQIPASDPKAAQARLKLDELRPTLKPQVAAKPEPAKPSGPQPVRPSAMPTQPPSSKLMLQTFSKGYDGPTGIAIGPGGYMYVANYSKNLIYRVGASGEKAVFTQGESIKGPIGLVYNPKMNELYVANYLLGNITRVNSVGKASVLVSGLNKPYNLYLDAINNVLYVSEQESNAVSRVILPQ
ncbi:MAG TPA: tetratricopeptide repeat protein [Coleofasciculaceae cyanobacterium]|jgi:tetratricopeptide (TPR) repeat protein